MISSHLIKTLNLPSEDYYKRNDHPKNNNMKGEKNVSSDFISHFKLVSLELDD